MRSMEELYSGRGEVLATTKAFLTARSHMIEEEAPAPARLEVNEDTVQVVRQWLSVTWDTANRAVTSGLAPNVDDLIRRVLSNCAERSERFAFIQAGRLMQMQQQGVIDATAFSSLQSRIGICNIFAALIVISNLPPTTKVEIPELR